MSTRLKRDRNATCAPKLSAPRRSPGVVTYLSRGTDDDAHGVLSGFGLTGEIGRTPGDDGFDVVYVTLREADLRARSGEPDPHGSGGVAQL